MARGVDAPARICIYDHERRRKGLGLSWRRRGKGRRQLAGSTEPTKTCPGPLERQHTTHHNSAGNDCVCAKDCRQSCHGALLETADGDAVFGHEVARECYVLLAKRPAADKEKNKQSFETQTTRIKFSDNCNVNLLFHICT